MRYLVKRRWRKSKRTGKKEYIGIPTKRFKYNKRTGEKYYYGQSYNTKFKNW